MADPQADTVKSPIIMKVDGPAEDNEKEENEDNEKADIEIKPNQVCSVMARPVLASPRFGLVNPFAAKSNNLSGPASPVFKSVLRPAQLGQASKGFTLNPSKLNPFARPTVATTTSETENNSTSKSANNVNGDAPKFVPLLHTEKSNEMRPHGNSIPKPPSSQSFVFGQNLQERIIAEPGDEPPAEPRPSTSVSTNGTPHNDMLFSSAIKDSPSVAEIAVPSKSLTESAREYEEQRANKRKYEEVEVKTGEEDETNVLHISCKLFAFDKTVGNWQERGRGNLRLNDQQIREDDVPYMQSRLVFRTSGVLRVILNTKIWAEMTIEQASTKSVRFTAMDSSGEIRVFLVMATPDEIKLLYKYLQERLTGEQRRQNLKKVNNNRDSETHQASSTDKDTISKESK